MEELLDFSRREFEAAHWYMDEVAAYQVDVAKDIRENAFERFMLLRNFVQTTQMELRARYLAIGYVLLEIKRDKLYNYVAPKDRGGCGYSSFKKFCLDVFGLSETTAKRLVRVAEAFCVGEGKLNPLYMAYTYSQLSELLTVDRQYWGRITSACSVRDIRHLSELYKEYVPSESSTVEKDLEEWRKIHEEKQARKNAKKNALRFVPAQSCESTQEQGPTSAPAKSWVDQPDNDDFDGEDSRDLSTPSLEKKEIPFTAIRDGLYSQLALLRKSDVGSAWHKCADIFEEALRRNAPGYVARHKDVVDAKIAIVNHQERGANDASGEIWIHKDMPEVLIRDAICKALSVLKNKLPSLNHAFCDIVADELDSGHMLVYDVEQYNLLLKSIWELRAELDQMKESGPVRREGLAVPAPQKVTLKNSKERKEWIEAYKDWPVWIELPEVSRTFYRFDFINGAAMLVEEYLWLSNFYVGGKAQICRRYYVIDAEHKEFCDGVLGGVSAVVEWLTKHSKEI